MLVAWRKKQDKWTCIGSSSWEMCSKWHVLDSESCFRQSTDESIRIQWKKLWEVREETCLKVRISEGVNISTSCSCSNLSISFELLKLEMGKREKSERKGIEMKRKIKGLCQWISPWFVVHACVLFRSNWCSIPCSKLVMMGGMGQAECSGRQMPKLVGGGRPQTGLNNLDSKPYFHIHNQVRFPGPESQ